MASLSNINGIFDVHSTGAILFSTSHGTSGQILKSNGNAAPTWIPQSDIVGAYLPLAGGTLTGATATATGISFTVGGTLTVGGNATFSSAVFTVGKLGVGTSDPGAEGYSFAEDLVILGGNSASDGAGITIRNNGKRYSVIAFGNGAGATGNDNDGEIYYDQTNKTMNFRTDHSPIVTFTNVGKVVAATATVAADSANTLTTKGYVDAIDHGVTQITAGTNVTITPVGGTGNVTINANTQGDLTAITLGNGLTGSSLTGPIPNILMSGSYTGTFTSTAIATDNVITSAGSLVINNPLDQNSNLIIAGRYDLGSTTLSFRSGHGGNANVWDMATIHVEDDGSYNGRIMFKTSPASYGNTPTTKMTIRSSGAIAFGTGISDYGSSGQILKSNGNTSPTWVDASTVIGGPYVTLGTAQTITASKTFSTLTYFTAGESIRLKGIRGQFTNEFMHLYNKVGIGNPAGWGQGETSTPNQGLSVYGGSNFAYGTSATSAFYGPITATGKILLNANNINFESGYSGNGLVLSHHGIGPSNAIVSGDSVYPDNLFINSGGAANDWSNVTIYGNVGIGTATPVSELQVGDHMAKNTITIGGWYAAGGGVLAFRSGYAPNLAYIWNTAEILATDDGNFNGRIEFKTSTISRAAPTIKMVLKANGRLGINTTTPDELVDITGGFLKFNGGDYGIKGSNSLTYYAVSDHYFQTNSGTKVVIKASGNVGINTTSPLNKLHVDGNVQIGGWTTAGSRYVGTARVDNGSWGNGAAGMEIQSVTESGQGNYDQKVHLISHRYNGGTTRVLTASWTTSNKRVGVGNETPSYNLDVTGTARITSRLGIGTAPDTAAAGDVLKIQGGNNGLGCIKAISGQYSYGVRIEGSNISTQLACYSSSTALTTQINFETAGNSSAGKITTTGNSTAYNTLSDYRVKENVIPISDSISRLNKLKPSRFNFIGESNKTVDGFIAHEVQDIVPEAIVGEKDEIDKDGNPFYQGIDQAKLVPLLVAAIQELEARVKELENK